MIGKRLDFGDTIGIISPSSPTNPNIIKKAINDLKSLGFKIKEGTHLFDKIGYLAGKDIDRATDIMDMFKDKNVDMILSMRGGYGAMRLLPYIDFNIIRQNPKIFMGFSDITILLNTFYSKCNLVTFHGPMGNSNLLNDTTTIMSFLNTLKSGYKPYSITNPTNIQCKSEIGGILNGSLVGGNLCLICSTLGTPYEIDTKDKILFIEEVGEVPYKIDRMLTQLLLSKKLQQCSGIILGQFTDCYLKNYDQSLKLHEVIEDRILSLNKPTMSNFMAGHGNPKITIPIGAKVNVNFFTGTINVLTPVVY